MGNEYESMRRLWVSVVTQHMMDTVKTLIAARNGKNRARLSTSGDGVPVGSYEYELESARRYFESRDYRDICDMAGVSRKPKQALARAGKMADELSSSGRLSKRWVREVLDRAT